MITLEIIFSFLIIHWIADFIFQTRWMADNKSKSNRALLAHVSVYTVVWFIFYSLFIIFGSGEVIDKLIENEYILWWFFPITFVAHFITDWCTSRITSRLYKQGRIHDFFVMIDFDQILHYTQLFLTYYFLVN